MEQEDMRKVHAGYAYGEDKYWWGEIKICPHITFFGEDAEKEENYEYDHGITFRCEVCKKEFSLNTLID